MYTHVYIYIYIERERERERYTYKGGREDARYHTQVVIAWAVATEALLNRLCLIIILTIVITIT